jgi:hypothetical protein
MIKYAACGKFAAKKDGLPLFNDGFNGKYHLSISFNSISNAVAFEFKVCIKETIDSVVSYYGTRLGKDFPSFMFEREEEGKEKIIPEKYYKTEKIHSIDKWKLIPYTDKALATLQNGQEAIRMMSEMLYKFVDQPTEQISITLNNIDKLSLTK